VIDLEFTSTRKTTNILPEHYDSAKMLEEKYIKNTPPKPVKTVEPEQSRLFLENATLPQKPINMNQKSSLVKKLWVSFLSLTLLPILSLVSTIGYYLKNFQRNSFYHFRKSWIAKTITIGVGCLALFTVLFVFGKTPENSVAKIKQQVKGIQENKVPEVASQPTSPAKPEDGYKKWAIDKFGKEADPFEDADKDQLTNNEEFIIGSDPKNPNSCDANKTDSENLIELVNPTTCKPIDLQNKDDVAKFRKVIDFQTVKTKTISQDVKTNQTSSPATNSTSVSGLFGSSSLEDLNKQEFNSSKLQADLDLIQKKEGVIKKIDRINEYMKKYRSLEPLDRNYPIPVNGAVYLEVSQQYNVPLKYVVAVAQRESRFGTDRYNTEGGLTRPGKYKNIYSMGLDDDGNNLGFETWEKGVESFGKWYKKFHDRGVSDCAKWRIYNPNGDYCKAVEDTANEIDIYLNK
jgi:hypothetical protein